MLRNRWDDLSNVATFYALDVAVTMKRLGYSAKEYPRKGLEKYSTIFVEIARHNVESPVSFREIDIL